MNKLNTKPQTTSFAMPVGSRSAQKLARRLIVLVSTDSDYTGTTRRISELANACGAHVLFLGLCKGAADELSLRRELVTLAALLRDARVSAEAKVETGMNWVEAVKDNLQAGDMIVCFAEQRVGLLHRPLSQILESNLGAPVYILAGLYPQSHSRPNWLAEGMAWIGSIGIIAGAFLLQVRIVSMPRDWAQTTLLILSMIAEAWFITAWNRLFG